MADRNTQTRRRAFVGQIADLPNRVGRWLGGLRRQVIGLVRPISEAPSAPPVVVSIQPPPTPPPAAPLSTAQPPAHWLAQVQGSGPPADWLARVQRGAPHLLEAMAKRAAYAVPRHPARSPRTAPKPPLVAEDTIPPSHDTAGDKPGLARPQRPEPSPPAHGAPVEMVERRVSLTSPKEPMDTPRAGRRQMSRPAVRVAEAVKSVAPPEAMPLSRQERPRRAQPAPLYVEARRTTLEPQSLVDHELKPPSPQPSPAPMTPTYPSPAFATAEDMEQGQHQPVMSLDDDWGAKAYYGGVQRPKAPDPSLDDVPRAWATLIAPPIWSEPTRHPQAVMPDTAPTRPSRVAERKARLDDTDDDAETEGRWPTLPADDPAADEGEMARRAWERRQRLDREQAGRL